MDHTVLMDFLNCFIGHRSASAKQIFSFILADQGFSQSTLFICKYKFVFLLQVR